MSKKIDNKFNLNEWYFVAVEDASERLLYFVMFLEYQEGKLLKTVAYDVHSEEYWEGSLTDEEDIESQLEAMELASSEDLKTTWLEEAAKEFQKTKFSHRYGPSLVRFIFKILNNS